MKLTFGCSDQRALLRITQRRQVSGVEASGVHGAVKELTLGAVKTSTSRGEIATYCGFLRPSERTVHVPQRHPPAGSQQFTSSSVVVFMEECKGGGKVLFSYTSSQLATINTYKTQWLCDARAAQCVKRPTS